MGATPRPCWVFAGARPIPVCLHAVRPQVGLLASGRPSIEPLIPIRCTARREAQLRSGDTLKQPFPFSLPKEKIKILLLEGISETAVAVFTAAGYSQIERR